MKRKYIQRSDNEWFHIRRRGHIIACCDCGLTHFFTPRLRNGRIYLKAVRLNRHTAGVRQRPHYCQPR